MKKRKGRGSPFILYPRQNIEEIRQCVLENFGFIKYELPFLNALCVEIPEERVQMIKTNRRVAAMSEDIQVSKLCTSESFFDTKRRMPKTNDYNHGEGVAIAVIDTGVAPHCDLIRPFNRILSFQDFVNGRILPYDDDGHGTHVSGIALGNGYSSGGEYRGTAPGAALVALKALDNEGNGNASDILAAMQWIYKNHKRYNIKVVNLSLGVLPSEGSQIDPLVLGANALIEAGICVIAAAGNSGPSRASITSPGVSPQVLTVGSCDSKRHIPDFSSRGPTPAGKIKPDLVSPGVDIISLSAQNPEGYVSHSGTSMSAPYVSGLAAKYFAHHPDASPKEVRQALRCCAIPIKKEDPNAQGCGALFED